MRKAADAGGMRSGTLDILATKARDLRRDGFKVNLHHLDEAMKDKYQAIEILKFLSESDPDQLNKILKNKKDPRHGPITDMIHFTGQEVNRTPGGKFLGLIPKGDKIELNRTQPVGSFTKQNAVEGVTVGGSQGNQQQDQQQDPAKAREELENKIQDENPGWTPQQVLDEADRLEGLHTRLPQDIQQNVLQGPQQSVKGPIRQQTSLTGQSGVQNPALAGLENVTSDQGKDIVRKAAYKFRDAESIEDQIKYSQPPTRNA